MAFLGTQERGKIITMIGTQAFQDIVQALHVSLVARKRAPVRAFFSVQKMGRLKLLQGSRKFEEFLHDRH